MASDWFHGRSFQPFKHTLRQTFGTQRGPASYTGSRSIINLVISGNLLVFGAWVYGAQTRNSRLLRTLTDNFTLSLRNLKEGRHYTALTSAFSHQEIGHIFFNLFNFWTFGQILVYAGIGPVNTAAVCLASAVAGSAAWVYHISQSSVRRQGIFNGQVVRANDMASALGASGMVMGVGAVAACLAPTMPMQLMFIPINIPLVGIVASYFVIDAYFLNSTKSRVGHSAHIGGAVAGAAYYLLFLRRFGGVASMLSRRRLR